MVTARINARIGANPHVNHIGYVGKKAGLCPKRIADPLKFNSVYVAIPIGSHIDAVAKPSWQAALLCVYQSLSARKARYRLTHSLNLKTLDGSIGKAIMVHWDYVIEFIPRFGAIAVIVGAEHQPSRTYAQIVRIS